MLLYNARNNQGFTVLETLIIVVILGILSAAAAPSFLGMLNKNKVNDAVYKVRGALQEAQREAIRKSKSCTVTIDTTNKKISSPCFVTGDRDLCEERNNTGNCTKSIVVLETNETSIQFSYKGTVTLSDAGTVVLFTADNTSNKKCLVISSPLGVLRTGNYTVTGTNGTCNTSR